MVSREVTQPALRIAGLAGARPGSQARSTDPIPNPFKIKVVVLDFDGTLTRVYDEAGPVVSGYKTDLALKLGISLADLEPMWEATKKRILSSPAHYGWLVDSRIVAPAHADPYIMARTIANELLNQHGMVLVQGERRDFLDGLFKRHYPSALTALKDDAASFIMALQNQYPVFIVTNSDTDVVTRKVAQLNLPRSNVLTILGNAKKYSIDDTWNAVPSSLDLEGFGHPVLLRRQKYAQVLDSIAEKFGITRQELLVVGDIFELDLSLPFYWGAAVCLVTSEHTPRAEREVVSNYQRGYVVANLSEALNWALAIPNGS